MTSSTDVAEATMEMAMEMAMVMEMEMQVRFHLSYLLPQNHVLTSVL